MEELHKVARAYYDNGSPEVRSLTQRFFESMDTDQDGKIQFHEFIKLLHKEGYINQEMNHYLFCELDVDRNGVLDFNEFLTLYCVIKTRNGFCCQCWRLLKGLYFTCVTCFDCPSVRTFDLCSDCYNVSNRRAYHPHMNFVDTTLLLRVRRSCCRSYDPNPSSSRAVEEFMQPTNSGQIQVHYHQCQPDAGWDKVKMMMRTLEIALAAGAVGVTAFCCIM
ncbi:hypothetical protein QQ045_019848 [Rhodiola kirilowii]